ncbi:hypothetical protein, partial [Streptomyces filamentosus]|uniref:hypothetical protein n=1 Tax=Streptomyces filamentosus TaxID=67294 RepID=UPI00331C094A
HTDGGAILTLRILPGAERRLRAPAAGPLTVLVRPHARAWPGRSPVPRRLVGCRPPVCTA